MNIFGYMNFLRLIVLVLLFIVLYNLFIIALPGIKDITEGLVNMSGWDVTQQQRIGLSDNVPYGYYLVSTDISGQTIARIPHGYVIDMAGKLVPITKAEMYSQMKLKGDMVDSKYTNGSKKNRYDSNNYNVQYHNDASVGGTDASPADDLAQTGTWILDKHGNKVLIPWSEVPDNITYYEPGSYPFGPSNYVPNYEDTVYLSKTSGQSQVGSFYDSASMSGGFCTKNANSPINLEQSCNALDSDTCSSTTCCVLLGGQKCVAGNQNGPTMKANYSDVLVLNKDFYYYQGKCYGNCAQ